MSAVTAALYGRLSGDLVLAAMLATYNGRPAVFTVNPVPGDAQLPYIVAAGHVSDNPWDTKTTRGREIRRDVLCYAEATGSMAQVEAIAERVRVLLHRQPLVLQGYRNVLVECTGPIVAQADEVAYGLAVTVRLLLEEV